MKLRMLGNSVRLRLKRSEVDRIAAGRDIVDETRFPSGTLRCRLSVHDGEAVSADFDHGCLELRLPKPIADRWAATDQVSISAEQTLGEGGEVLSLLIEKDFQCLSPGHHRSPDEDADTFPHPEAETGKGC